MNRIINITLTDTTQKQFEFETFGQIKDFCINEHEYWKNANESIGKNITLSQARTKLNHLQAIMDNFSSWEEIEPTWDENTFNTSFQQLKKNHLRHLSGDWIWHGHAFVTTWIKLHDKSQVTADSFLVTVLKENVNTIGSSVDHMIGHILGYEFLMQDESEITKRRSAEKESFAQLREELNNNNKELISEVDIFKDDLNDWNSSMRAEAERLYEVRKKLGERQIKNQQRSFSKQINGWSEKIGNLEKTYEDVLRLRKPAEYWNIAAKKYRWQGLGFLLLIIIFVVVGLIGFGIFFLAWLMGHKQGVELNTIQGIVIFGTIVTAYAFLIRILSRLAFSSFHLMRDSEEREQLTYLYLSLSEETSVEEGSRNIVLQALFSRTETGLITQEHGPTMPSISDAIRFATKSGRSG